MPTFKVFPNEKKLNKKGEAPIYLRIIQDRKATHISLRYHILLKDWDFENSRVKKSHSNSIRMNNFIAQKLAGVQGHSLEVEGKEKSVNSKTIKKAVFGDVSQSFLKYADRYVADLKHKAKPGTHDKASAVISKIKTYLGTNKLLFEDITVNWLKNYDMYLRTQLHNTTNTLHGNYKIIRRLINEAVNEEILPIEKNPFLRYKMKTEKTNIEYMTDEELAKIENLELPKSSKRDIHRDMYVFAAYTGGIRISDILQLKWKNFNGTHIITQMQKTGNPLSVKVPSTGLTILEKYKPDEINSEDFILPILRNEFDYSDPHFLFKAISSATAYTNKDLKEIAKKAEIKKRLHFHTSRHTFATRALRKGMRMEYTSKILGHSNLKTTQIYAKVVNEELDKAMDLMN